MGKLIKIKAFIGLSALAALAGLLPTSALAVNEATVTHPTGNSPSLLNILGTNKETPAPDGKGEHWVSLLTTSGGVPVAECTTATITAELQENTGKSVKAEVTTGPIGEPEKYAVFKGTPGATPHTAHCKSSFGTITVTTDPEKNGLPWCLRSNNTMATDEFQVTGGKCSEAPRPINFILHSSIAGKCEYERKAPIVGTYATHPEDAILHVSKQEFVKVAGGGFCPASGFLDLTQRLSAETTAGVETGLWISKGA